MNAQVTFKFVSAQLYPIAQADAVNIVFQTKVDSNAESTDCTVGLMTMAGKGYVSFHRISSLIGFTYAIVY